MEKEVIHTEEDVNEKDISPYHNLISKIEMFFSDVGYINDYFKDVARLLEKNEKIDSKKLEKLVKKITTEDGIDTSLKEVKELIRQINRLVMTNQTFKRNIIVSLVSRYDELMNDILFYLWKDNKFEIKGEKVYSIKELKVFDNMEEVFEDSMRQEIDDFMYKCHYDQIVYLDSYFKLGLVKSIEDIDKFIELCERRNLIVHNGCKVNSKYKAKLKSNNIAIDEDNIKNDLIIIDNKYVDNAINMIFEVAFKITQNLVRRLYADDLYDFEKITNEDIGFILMNENNWNLAKIVYSYISSLPPKFIENDAWLKMYIINHCICLFHLGKTEEMLKVIDNVDWSSAGKEYDFAILILRENYEEAKNEMLKMDGKYPSKDDFLNWPLFKCFRETDEFKIGFKELFGVEAYDAILEEEIKEINDIKADKEIKNDK